MVAVPNPDEQRLSCPSSLCLTRFPVPVGLLTFDDQVVERRSALATTPSLITELKFTGVACVA
jgi:hypothetical protein